MKGVPSRRLPAPDWALGEPPMPLMRDLPPASPFPEEAMGAIGAEVVALMHRIIQALARLLASQSSRP